MVDVTVVEMVVKMENWRVVKGEMRVVRKVWKGVGTVVLMELRMGRCLVVNLVELLDTLLVHW